MNSSSEQQANTAWWADLLVLAGLGVLLFSLLQVGQEWNGAFRDKVEIDLSPWALPKYTMYSLARGLVAYVFSLSFTLIYASWAYYSPTAGQILVPLLDVLQSIPVLGFLPGLVLALVAIFPHSNLGLELACVLMIFTGQVWNMTFSFYDSLRAVPADLRAITRQYQFTPWERFTRLELPCGANGLVYNSMMSMAGGWFFLTITEAFTLKDHDFRLPGIGSYMSVAADQNDNWAKLYGSIAMILMIVFLDQLLWRPLVVWVQRFKLEDTEAVTKEESWFLSLLLRSKLLSRLSHRATQKMRMTLPVQPAAGKTKNPAPTVFMLWFYRGILAGCAGVAVLGVVKLSLLMWQVSGREWGLIGYSTLLTFLRVFAAVTLGTLWAVPVGVWIGLNPRWARLLQPLTQVAASYPAPMIYSVVVTALVAWGGTLNWGSIFLIMLGTQWYVLFNVISGASAIPQDLISCAQITQLRGWVRWRVLFLPAIFPAVLTGWITATGGAWNASIVAEYVQLQSNTYIATGLGSLISKATNDGNFPVLAAAVLAMAISVVALNRILWKPLQRLADQRYRLGV